MTEYYCPEHKYNPPEGSGLCFCPRCEFPEEMARADKEAAESARMALIETLEQIRDLARTDLPLDIGLTEEMWAKSRLISIAVMAGRAIAAAKGEK